MGRWKIIAGLTHFSSYRFYISIMVRNRATVFSLKSTPGAYEILKLISAALIRRQRQLEGGAYCKVKGNERY